MACQEVCEQGRNDAWKQRSTYRQRPYKPYTALVNPRFHVCKSRSQTRPMTVVFRFGTRLRVRIRTTFENGVLRNGQQPASAVNNFIDQGEFGAMKTLSGHIAPRCDKHQFCDKMTVSTWTVFELSLFEQSGRNEERMRKMSLLQPRQQQPFQPLDWLSLRNPVVLTIQVQVHGPRWSFSTRKGWYHQMALQRILGLSIWLS